MAISPTSISALLNLNPPNPPGMTVVADKDLTGGVTTGTPINQPDLFIPGGSHGTENDVLVDGAQQVVPFYDGTNYAKTSLPSKQPASFSTAPGSMDLNASPPDNFTVWNSAYQAEYVKANGGSAHGMVTIGKPGNQIHVVLAATNDRVIVLENLQKNDFAKLSAADQANIAATSFFTSTLGPTLNLTTDNSQAMTTINTYLTALGMTVPSPPGNFYADYLTTPSGAVGSTPDGINLSYMSAADRKIFVDELKLLGKQILAMSVFSNTDLANATTAITNRLALAARFSYTTDTLGNTGAITTNNLTGAIDIGQRGLISADGNVTIVNGYKNLITQEGQIRNVALSADQVDTSATLNNKKLDAPTLIFYFQLDANLEQEAQINASTEEIKQLNALLNLYSQMQNIINQTLQQFGDDPKQKLGLLGKSTWSDIPSAPPVSTQVVVSIFEDYMGTGVHPLEKMYGIQKPVAGFDILNNTDASLPGSLKDTWNALNSSLSDTVSQLNQQSQLKMNDINSATKQKDRHFDLANNALSKMNDMIQTIGRGLA